jgi:hypothetical protein
VQQGELAQKMTDRQPEIRNLFSALRSLRVYRIVVPMLKRIKSLFFKPPTKESAVEIPDYLKAEIRAIAEETLAGDVVGGVCAIKTGNRILEFVNSHPKEVRERIWNYVLRIREEANLYAESLAKDAVKT